MPQRTRCPFYGFNGMFGVMMDSEGNQCALINDSYSPCQMEIQDQRPDWTRCNLLRDNAIPEETLKNMRVFPKEFHPEGHTSWNGFTLGEWMDYVLNGKNLPRQ